MPGTLNFDKSTSLLLAIDPLTGKEVEALEVHNEN